MERSKQYSLEKLYLQTKRGLVTQIYKCQRSHSKHRGHPMPTYSKQELKEWLYSQKKFHELFNKWENSGYKRAFIPSCDRLDDYKPYTFDNLQLVKWKENNQKSHRDIKNGINNKRSKAIIGTNIDTGDEVEFYSIAEAERKTGINHTHISECCRGIHGYTGGYTWKYKN